MTLADRHTAGTALLVILNLSLTDTFHPWKGYGSAVPNQALQYRPPRQGYVTSTSALCTLSACFGWARLVVLVEVEHGGFLVTD